MDREGVQQQWKEIRGLTDALVKNAPVYKSAKTRDQAVETAFSLVVKYTRVIMHCIKEMMKGGV